MTHHAFYVKVDMIERTHPKECWKPDCKEKSIFIFDFMDNPFPTCAYHADEFLMILKETYRIFRIAKASDAK